MPRPTRHILLIDDSFDDRADLRQMLLRAGNCRYRFSEAELGAEGVRQTLWTINRSRGPADEFAAGFLNLKASFLIGDKRSDLEAGAAAGCRTTLVRTGHGSSEERNLLPGLPGFLGICDTLADAARLVLRLPQRESFSNIPVRAWA